MNWSKLLVFIVILLSGCEKNLTNKMTMCQNLPHWAGATEKCDFGSPAPCRKILQGRAEVVLLRVRGACPSHLVMAIKDQDSSEQYWSRIVKGNNSLKVTDFRVDYGESLYLGTLDANDKLDPTCCFIEIETKKE